MRIIWSLKKVNEPHRRYAYVASNYKGMMIYRDTAIRPPYFTYVLKFGSIEKMFETAEEAKEAARDQIEDNCLQETRNQVNDIIRLVEAAETGIYLGASYIPMIREHLSDALGKLRQLHAGIKD